MRGYGPVLGQRPGWYPEAPQTESIVIFCLFIVGLEADSFHNILQAGLILAILLSQYPQNWDYRYVQPFFFLY